MSCTALKNVEGGYLKLLLTLFKHVLNMSSLGQWPQLQNSVTHRCPAKKPATAQDGREPGVLLYRGMWGTIDSWGFEAGGKQGVTCSQFPSQ